MENTNQYVSNLANQPVENISYDCLIEAHFQITSLFKKKRNTGLMNLLTFVYYHSNEVSNQLGYRSHTYCVMLVTL